MTNASDIPIAHTPYGGWHGEMPPPVLAGCDEPLVTGAPDLRGLWEAYQIEVKGEVIYDPRRSGNSSESSSAETGSS